MLLGVGAIVGNGVGILVGLVGLPVGFCVPAARHQRAVSL